MGRRSLQQSGRGGTQAKGPRPRTTQEEKEEEQAVSGRRYTPQWRPRWRLSPGRRTWTRAAWRACWCAAGIGWSECRCLQGRRPGVAIDCTLPGNRAGAGARWQGLGVRGGKTNVTVMIFPSPPPSQRCTPPLPHSPSPSILNWVGARTGGGGMNGMLNPSPPFTACLLAGRRHGRVLRTHAAQPSAQRRAEPAAAWPQGGSEGAAMEVSTAATAVIPGYR